MGGFSSPAALSLSRVEKVTSWAWVKIFKVLSMLSCSIFLVLSPNEMKQDSQPLGKNSLLPNPSFSSCKPGRGSEKGE